MRGRLVPGILCVSGSRVLLPSFVAANSTCRLAGRRPRCCFPEAQAFPATDRFLFGPSWRRVLLRGGRLLLPHAARQGFPPLSSILPHGVHSSPCCPAGCGPLAQQIVLLTVQIHGVLLCTETLFLPPYLSSRFQSPSACPV